MVGLWGVFAFEVQGIQCSNAAARAIGRWVSHPKSIISSDSLYLPRIYENSIPLYDIIDKASAYLTINKIATKLVPFNIAFFLPEPTLALFTYGLLYSVYYVMMGLFRGLIGRRSSTWWSRWSTCLTRRKWPTRRYPAGGSSPRTRSGRVTWRQPLSWIFSGRTITARSRQGDCTTRRWPFVSREATNCCCSISTVFGTTRASRMMN